MKKITLWQRILRDTPAFFKRMQMFGAGLVTLSISLSNIAGIPANIPTILATAGATMVAVSQFAIKQYDDLPSSASGADNQPTRH